MSRLEDLSRHQKRSRSRRRLGIAAALGAAAALLTVFLPDLVGWAWPLLRSHPRLAGVGVASLVVAGLSVYVAHVYQESREPGAQREGREKSESAPFASRHRHTAFLVVAGPLAAGAVWLTFTRLLGLSTIAAGLLAAVALMGLSALHDKTLLRDVDLFATVAEDPVALALYAGLVHLGFALCLALA
jgi:hypothetical protein